MQVLIRADAYSAIGTGHVMRCMALAEALIKDGHAVTYLGRCDAGTLLDRLLVMSVKCVQLDRIFPESEDLKSTLHVLGDFGSPEESLLVLDGYGFDETYHHAVREAGFRLLVLDDIHHLERYECDYLLNQNAYALSIKYRVNHGARLLLGPQYAMLRPEFLRRIGHVPVIPERASRILVTMGGADPDEVTVVVLKALALLHDPELEVRVAAGANYPRPEALTDLCASLPFSCRVFHAVEDMSVLMDWSDLAISAGGSTCWELCFMGVPVLALCLADNQRGIVRWLESEGAGLNLGDDPECWTERIVDSVSDLFNDPGKRTSMSENGRSRVDGSGARRVSAVVAQEIL